MKRFFLLLALTLFLPESAYATRIYNLVDYPDIQNGHSLRGTITTTDDAPDDGLLQTEEILDWEWEISGKNSATASKTADSLTQVIGIRISDSQIDLPLDSSAALRLSSPPTDDTWQRLAWNNLTPTAMNEPFTTYYTAGHSVAGRGGLAPYWFTLDLELNQYARFTVATAIPEPSTSLMGILFAAFGMMCFGNRIR